MTKKKKEFGRYQKHGNALKISTGWRTVLPVGPLVNNTSIVTPFPQTQAPKRKTTKTKLMLQLSLYWKKNTVADNNMRREIAEKKLATNKKIGKFYYVLKTRRENRGRACNRTKPLASCITFSRQEKKGSSWGLLAESRKAGMKFSADLKVSNVKQLRSY